MTFSPRMLWCAAVALTICFGMVADAAVMKGTIESSRSKDNFVFLGKFCYDYTTGVNHNKPGGLLELELTALNQSAPIVGEKGLQFWIFDDEDSSWPSLKFKGVSCDQRRTHARGAFAVRFDRTNASFPVYKHKFDISQHLRPRFWWFVLANCEGEFKNLRYKVHTTNINARHINKEFGVNKFNITMIYNIGLTCFMILFAVHAYGIHQYRARFAAEDKPTPPLHSAVVVFTVAIISMIASLALNFIHYAVYALDGEGLWVLELFGDFLDIASRLQVTDVVLLLSSGWTVLASSAEAHSSSSGSMSRSNSQLALGVFGSLYMVVALVGYDAPDKQTVNVTPSTALFLDFFTLLWLVVAAVVLRTAYLTYSREYKPHRRRVYFTMMLLYTFWLTTEPVVVLLTQLIDPWVRDKIVLIVTLSVTFVAYSWMTWVFWPSHDEEYFNLAVPSVQEETLDKDPDEF